jgi:hypothetical protein
MYVGNIVTSLKLDEENFNIYSDLESIDNDLPTLIIGWDNAKEFIGENISILHKKINQKLYWTFSKKERKVDFEVDLEKFKEVCFNTFGDNIPYVYLDILHGKNRINKIIIKKILSLINPIIYISDKNMVYIYGENIIFGIDLNIIEYSSIKKEKILNRIKNLNNNVLVTDEIFNKCKDLLYKIKYKNKLIPYIYKNGEFG